MNFSAWRLQSATGVHAGSGDAREVAHEGAQVLVGRRLDAVVLPSLHLDAMLTFGDTDLRTFVSYTGTDPALYFWKVRFPNGEQLVAGPGMHLRLG